MLYNTYEETGKISMLGFGAMRLPLAPGSDKIDYDSAKKLIDTAYANGVNYYDTAYPYHGGQSQLFLAKALADYPRDSFYLATKLPMWLVDSREKAQQLFEEQLKTLETSYFDFYLFHSLSTEAVDKIEKFGLRELAEEWKAAGKVRNIGFSIHDTPDVLRRLCDTWQWDFAQIMYNYIDAELTQGQELYDILDKRGIPCIIMEPVRGGRLADLGPKANAILEKANPAASIASWAMRWFAGKDNILTILSGMNTPEQLGDNLATLGAMQPFTAEEAAALNEAIKVFRDYALIPCTACQYCMPCPAGVDIPGMFALHNECAFDGTAMALQEKYAEVPVPKNAGNCASCGTCEAVCPQHLSIIELLAKLHTTATA